MGGGSGPRCEILSNPGQMDNSTAMATLGSVMFAIFLAIAVSGISNFAEIQKSSLKLRLASAGYINVTICCASLCLHFMHVFGGLLGADHGMLNKMSFFEYLLTCPWMMLVMVILGGPAVNGDRWRPLAVITTQMVLLFGFAASLISGMMLKIVCFVFGSGLFAGLMYMLDRMILEHSNGKERLFQIGGHGSPYKALGKKLFLTWLLFPLWWLVSPEGLSIVDSHEIDSLVKLLLNCFAKGLYVVYIRVLQHKFENSSEIGFMPPDHYASKDHHAAQDMRPPKYFDERMEHSDQSTKTVSGLRVSADMEDIENGNRHDLPVWGRRYSDPCFMSAREEQKQEEGWRRPSSKDSCGTTRTSSTEKFPREESLAINYNIPAHILRKTSRDDSEMYCNHHHRPSARGASREKAFHPEDLVERQMQIMHQMRQLEQDVTSSRRASKERAFHPEDLVERQMQMMHQMRQLEEDMTSFQSGACAPTEVWPVFVDDAPAPQKISRMVM